MAEKPNRWILQVVLLMAVFSLVGVSLFPLLSAALNQPAGTAANGGTPNLAAPNARQAELESQVKGYELVLQREPDNQTALKGVVDAKLELRDLKGTIVPLQRLAKLNPSDARYSVLLAQVQQYTGDREAAAQTYRTILGTNPGDLDALQGLVGLLLEQTRPEAAIGLLQDTLKTAGQKNQVQPGSIDTLSVQLMLGQVYATQKRYEEAVALYDEAIKANRQEFRPVLSKALVLQEQGKVDEAKPLFITAAALAPAQYKDEINRLAAGPSASVKVTTKDTTAKDKEPKAETSPGKPGPEVAPANAPPTDSGKPSAPTDLQPSAPAAPGR